MSGNRGPFPVVQSSGLKLILSNWYQFLFFIFYFLFFVAGIIFPEKVRLLIEQLGAQFLLFLFNDFDRRIVYSITLVSLFVLLEFFRSLLPLVIGSMFAEHSSKTKTGNGVFLFLLLILVYYISSVYSVVHSQPNTANDIKNFGSFDFAIDFISTWAVACSITNIAYMCIEKLNFILRK